MITPLQLAGPLGIGLVVLALVGVLAAYLIIKTVKPLIVNAIVGLVVLWLAGFVGLGVEITPIVILLVAFGGVPAALLAIVLAQFEIIFTPAAIGLALLL